MTIFSNWLINFFHIFIQSEYWNVNLFSNNFFSLSFVSVYFFFISVNSLTLVFENGHYVNENFVFDLERERRMNLVRYFKAFAMKFSEKSLWISFRIASITYFTIKPLHYKTFREIHHRNKSSCLMPIKYAINFICFTYR